MFKKFANYVEERKDGVDAKEGLVGNPKVKLVADYDGPDPKKPTKGDGQGDLAPYKSANANVAAKKAETGGFADLGDKNLKYNPDTDGGSSKLTALGTEIKGEWPKAAAGLPKTEQFMRKTKNMTVREFAEYMIKSRGKTELKGLPMVNADAAGPFHPHPSEAVRYVAALGSKSEKIIEQLVHELRRANILGEVFKAALEYPESYRELSSLFENEDGERRAKFFARALKETVGPPMGLKPEDDEDEENPHHHPEDDMDNPDGESDDMDDDSMDNDEDDDQDRHTGDEDVDGDEDDNGEEDDDLGDDDAMAQDGEEGEEGDMGPPTHFGKPMKKSAHSNIMGSMSKMGL